MKRLHISAVQYITKANVVYLKVVSLYQCEGTVDNQTMLAEPHTELIAHVIVNGTEMSIRD
jgi:hypothetical protein